MNVYVSVLIDKNSNKQNISLKKQLKSSLRKEMKIPSKRISSQELNTFLFLVGEKEKYLEGLDKQMVNNIERSTLYKKYLKYNNEIMLKIKKYLQDNQELKETSQIVKNFVKNIDSKLAHTFDTNLQGLTTNLPKLFSEISNHTFVTSWDFDQEFLFYLSGFEQKQFTVKKESNYTNGEVIDKLLIINFLNAFLPPTINNLERMVTILDQISQVIADTQFKAKDKKLQNKYELFLRILIAKLSALQDLDSLYYRIFKLFDIPRTELSNTFTEIIPIIDQVKEKIDSCKKVLVILSDKIKQCQLKFTNYLDASINGIKTLEKIDFKNKVRLLAETSLDLFIQSESLKIWSDHFTADIPYFSFNTELFKALSEQEVSEDTIIATRGLFKNYRLGKTTVYALRGVTLDIKEGEFVAIVGSSGAGKTTFLNCLAGLDTPDSGVVYFRGKDLHKMSDSKKSRIRLTQMGFIFQSYALLPHFNAQENVELPAELLGFSKDLKNRIKELLVGVGIDKQAKQFPAQLSGGQMQRVAIARALTNQPAVIFADEPTGDLDSVTGKQVMDLLKKFHEETKTTIILITHEQEVANYADRIIQMEDGKIVENQDQN